MQATLKPHIFDSREAIKFKMTEGSTINNFIVEAKLPAVLKDHIRADVNGVPVLYADFNNALKHDDLVNIYVVPMGGDSGKSILRLVAMIAVVVTAGALAPMAGAILGIYGAVGTTALTMAFTAIGMLAVNALIPPPSLDTGGYNSDAPANIYTITGQSNIISPYGVIPRLYGTHLFFPRLCVQPLVWNSDRSSYMSAVYDFGFAEIQLNDIRLGATSIDSFKTNTNYLPNSKGESLVYYTQNVNIQSISLELLANNSIARETATETKTAEIELSFPQGLVEINDSGDHKNTDVSLKVEYRVAGSSDTYTVIGVEGRGIGVISLDTSRSLDVELDLFAGSEIGAATYKLLGTQLICDLSEDLSVGDQISNTLGDTGIDTAEYRNVTQNVTAGIGKTVHIDREFTNFTRLVDSYDPTEVKKYFPTNYAKLQTDIIVENNTIDAFTITALITFPTVGKYEVRVTRLTEDSDDFKLQNKTYFTLFRSFIDDISLDLDTEHTLLELNIKANEQINGVVENLNAIAKSKLRTWKGTHFRSEFSTNPAWIVLDILTGTANAGAISMNQIDLAGFLRFANYCDELVTVQPNGEASFTEKRHKSSFVITALTTVSSVVQSVLSQARASLKISNDGKYGILYDISKTEPVQLFTTRNSSGFSGERTYADIPHALKVKYINPAKSYEIDEVIVYADGYDYLTAELFETVDTFGIVDYYEAWRHGRYTLAQMIAYQETFTLTVDLEHLSVQRGELVSVQNDIPQIGGLPLRVKEVLDGGKTIIVNDKLEHDGIKEYHYLVRANDHSIETGVIQSVTDDVTIVLAVANPNIRVRDIFVYGFKDYVTKDYLVSSIIPRGDLKATISLIPYSADVYTADTGSMPVYDSGIAPEIGGECRLKVKDLTVDYSVTYENRLPVPTFDVNFNVDSTAPFKTFMVEWASNGINGLEFTVAGYTEDTEFIFTLGNLIENKSLIGKEIIIRVTPISTRDNLCIASNGVPAIITDDVTVPDDVDFFNCNIVSETLNLTWKANRDPDISHYVIRYNESTDPLVAVWERSVLLTSNINYETLRHTTNARTGTYLIKAVDTSGNVSVNAVKAVTSIPDLIGLNFITAINDAPDWVGTKENLVVVEGALKTDIKTAVSTCGFTVCDGLWNDGKPWSDSITWLDTPVDYAGTDYHTNGRYVFDGMYDLGDIYTARISTAIDAYAQRETDLMYQWVRLSDLDILGNIEKEEWNAYVMVSMADQLDSISTWETLDSVIAMADSSGANWTEQVLSEMGDFTGRYFKFELLIESVSAQLRVAVNDAKVTLDMPDRIISDNDIISDVGSHRVDFYPAFYVSPALGITQDNAQKGDRYVITNKSRTGFNIAFFDIGDTAVSRQFDFMARAYGSMSTSII